MNYVNPPAQPPPHVTHQTFYSERVGSEIGYNIYLPPAYGSSDRPYPVAYHLHGYQGNESSELWAMEKVCRDRQAITVFVNNTPGDNGYRDNELLLETMFITELIPRIDTNYRTDAAREGRSLSGFSMGGAGAFYYAVKYPGLFGSVTAYAGTYHHFYCADYRGVGEPLAKAAGFYEKMSGDDACFDRDGVLKLRQNAEKLRGSLHITLQVGTADPLICDNEIMHFYLNSLAIPHEYVKIAGVAHELDKIV